MSIDLVTKYSEKVDELFKAESKLSLLTNTDYDFDGAHTVRVYKVSTANLSNYQRNYTGAQGETEQLSRFGTLTDLSATTEYMTLSRDRSFIFNIDKMDNDETAQALASATALAREVREVVIPEIDAYVYDKIVTGAGTTEEETLTKLNVYDAILAGSEVLDDNEVPDTERCLIVPPATYKLIKQAIAESGNAVSEDLRLKGVVAVLDGMNVIKVPASKLPEGTNFIIVHPSATVAPIKLADYGVHTDTPLASGDIVTGRIVYDAFILDNKAMGIYASMSESES